MAIRIFKSRHFNKWCRKEGVTNKMLKVAVQEVEDGLYEANLGGFLIKKRVAKPGHGKRGSYRTIMAYRQGAKIFFLFGFDKNERENIGERELKALHKLGDVLIGSTDAVLAKWLKDGELMEVEK
ncbi:type II toxin-antitoxin system RelE/ParE family toxin [uncultured Ferrovibrio sp.]|jgi:hypothetical protein|uniref:type II toxin-antitoxin system RelE/ParE family toxin n=1 Tax=uncultured Ferrovibrio sp. TaxID=1576913 RepID=UPI00261DC134|nr:type II toxin-antitoxin system RelE/ParE family toxin [uncultured Ferrovibrio sp.]